MYNIRFFLLGFNHCMWSFVPLENFSRIWRRHHCQWGATNFDLCSALMIWCDMHTWPLSSEGSLACHTYCDMGHPFLMVTSEDPWQSHLSIAECLAVELSLGYLFLWLRSVDWDLNTQPSACEANALTYCATAVVLIIVIDSMHIY